MYLSNNIKLLRKKRGISQDELAERLNKSKGLISSYERGRTLPPLDIVIELCKIFQVNIDEFVNKDLSKESAQPTPVQEAQEQHNTTDTKLLMELMKEKLVEVSKEMKKENPDKYKKLNLDKLSDLLGED